MVRTRFVTGIIIIFAIHLNEYFFNDFSTRILVEEFCYQWLDMYYRIIFNLLQHA